MRAVSSRRRSWPQRLLIAFNCCVVVFCLVAAGGLLFVQRQVSDVPRLAVGEVLDEKQTSTEPQNVMLVGVDDGRGLENDDPILKGRSTSLNTDTIMILRVDPTTGSAALLSLPRDLWVPIAGSNRMGKINSALALGGPERLIATIQENFGIPVHHYVQVNFAGFKGLVEEAGGVEIYFPWQSRDDHTGWYNEETGCLTLDKDQALAFARSRYFEINEGDGWIRDPYHDINRARRQQVFVQAAMKRAIAQGARNPFVLSGLVGVAQQNVTLDDLLTTQDILDLGSHFRDFNPDDLQMFVAPTTGGMVGDASVQHLNEREAQPIFDIFRGVEGSDDAAAGVRVEVRNGSGRSGEGAQVRDELAGHGFVVPRATDARSFQVTRTEIRYAPGAEDDVIELARYLEVTPVVVEDSELPPDVSVVLVTGSDFRGIRTEPRSADDMGPVRSQLPTTTTSQVVPGEGSFESTTTTTVNPALRFVPQTPEGQSCG